MIEPSAKDGGSALGSTSRKAISSGCMPMTRAPATKSRSRIDRISARAMRAGPVQAPSAMATTTVASDGPATLTKASASRKVGTVWNASVTRISTSSTMPPAKPAMVPTTPPASDRRGGGGQTDAATCARRGQVRRARRGQAGRCRADVRHPGRAAISGGAGDGERIAGKTSGASRRHRRRPRSSSAARRALPASAGICARSCRRLAGADARIEPGVERGRRCRLTRITTTALARMMPSSSGVSRAADRLLRQPADARGSANTRLDHDAAAEHRGGLQAEHRHDRQQGVARDMAQHDPAPRQARARGRASTKSMPPGLGHARAHHAQVKRHIDQRRGSRPAAPDAARCRATRREAGLARGDRSRCR